MKKLLLILLLLAQSIFIYAQKTDSLKRLIQKNAEKIDHGGNNELKFNLILAIAGMPELSYERMIRDNMGIGAAISLGLDHSADYKFNFTSYYRLYFGAQKISGFFIEGNTGIVTLTDEYYANTFTYPIVYTYQYTATTTSVSLGAAAGYKLLTRNGLFAEAYLGISKLIGDRNGYNISKIPRLGISLGKRF